MARHRTAIPPFITPLLRRHPWAALLLAAVGGLWYANEWLYARPAMSYGGVPAAVDWQPAHWTHILRDEAMLIGWSDLRGTPLWVIYRLHPVAADARHYRRPPRFERDWRVLNAIGHDDYDGSGYDHGHLAPNYAISRLYGPQAQAETFLMSNVAPQRPRLNQKLWQRLEEVEIDVFAPRYGDLWVITGPIFDNDVERLRHSWRVEVPDAFYKIYVRPPQQAGEPPQVLAFIMPQQVRGNEPLDRYLASIDEIEARTGFDFLPQLEAATQRQVEASITPTAWNLAAVARLPPRY